jgi:hypothetical protein
MKALWRAVKVRPLLFLVLCTTCARFQARAQINSWTNLVSGNWEDAYWSLGLLPGTNQTILFTNEGSKTLTIGLNTMQNFPESLDVDSITISAPPGSSNTFLLTNAGPQAPLTVRSLTLASDCLMALFSSGLQLNGPNGVGMQVGGEFDQTDSMVAGNQVNVGYISPGIYNLNSGTIAVSHLWVGAPYAGLFNQNGGTNASGIIHVEGGEYDLNDGYFAGTIYFTANGTFRQRGGVLNSLVSITYGNYSLEGGINYGGVSFPQYGFGTAVQSGGTNFGGVDLGGFYGGGSYIMSNGVSYGGISVGGHASFTLLGGSQLCETQGVLVGVTFEASRDGGYGYSRGHFTQSGGLLSCSGMAIYGICYKWGGTTLVSGTVRISGPQSQFISSGTLCASNFFVSSMTIGPAYFNGTTVITNEINVIAASISGGGDLTVSNITVQSGSFGFDGNSLNQSGIVGLAGGGLNASGSGAYHFGQLQLNSGANSLAISSDQCVLNFKDSSSLAWTNTANLNVQNWSGSLYGGGQQQIIFGTNATALTPQQLSQIQFQNPAGLAPSNYPARILATGEIVPDTGAPLPPMMNLSSSANGVMRLSLGGDIGRTYTIEVSTDLMHWNAWTNQLNTSGTMTLDDYDPTNCPQRFYRMRVMP